MDLVFSNASQLSVHQFLRKGGYSPIRDYRTKKESYVRTFGTNKYPRFHIYILNNSTSSFKINLHLDMKEASYEGHTRHAGEYDTKPVHDEANRLKAIYESSVEEPKKEKPTKEKKSWWDRIFYYLMLKSSSKVKLIINPRAGSMRGRIPPLNKISRKSLGQIYVPKQPNRKIIETIQEAFKKKGIHIEVHTCRKRGDAITTAKEAADLGYEMVIAAGGDGTINEVINGLAHSQTILGVLPLGTANSFAAEIDIPFELDKAIDILLNGDVREIDLGQANKRYFSVATGIGFDAAAIKEVRSGLKRWTGSFAYLIAVIKTLVSYRFHKITVEIPERHEVRHGYFCMVCNTRSYAGIYELTHDAVIDDGKLDIIIFKGKEAHRVLIHLIKLAIGIFSPKKNYDMDYIKAKEVIVKSKNRLPVHVDGELIGSSPVHAKIHPKSLKVMVQKA